MVLSIGVNDLDLYWHYPSPCLHGNVWPCLTALSSLCRARSRLSLWPGRKFRLMMRRATTWAHQRKLLKLLLKEYVYIYNLYIMIYIYIVLLLCSKIKKQPTLFYYVTSPPSMPSNKGNEEPSGAHCLDRESGCCGVKALVPNEHQNSWHSWMFVGPKMVPSALTQPIWFDQQLKGMMIILDVIIDIMEHYYHISIIINDPARTLLSWDSCGWVTFQHWDFSKNGSSRSGGFSSRCGTNRK